MSYQLPEKFWSVPFVHGGGAIRRFRDIRQHWTNTNNYSLKATKIHNSRCLFFFFLVLVVFRGKCVRSKRCRRFNVSAAVDTKKKIVLRSTHNVISIHIELGKCSFDIYLSHCILSEMTTCPAVVIRCFGSLTSSHDNGVHFTLNKTSQEKNDQESCLGDLVDQTCNRVKVRSIYRGYLSHRPRTDRCQWREARSPVFRSVEIFNLLERLKCWGNTQFLKRT